MKITKTKVHGNTRWRVDYYQQGKRCRSVFDTEALAKAHAESQTNAEGEVIRQISALPMAEQGVILAAYQMAKEKGLNLYDLALSNSPAEISTEKVSTVIELYLHARANDPDERVAPQTWNGYNTSLKNFEVRFGNIELSAITPDAAETYLKSLTKSDGSPISQQYRKNEKVKLGTFFNWAIRRKHISKNPLDDYKVTVNGDADITWLNANQMRHLLKACLEIDPAMIPFFALGPFGGLRLSEYRGTSDKAEQGTPGTVRYTPLMKGKDGITWEHVKLEADTPHIIIPKEIAKTNSRRVVHLEPTLVEWLKLGGDLYPIRNSNKRSLAVRKRANLGKYGEWAWGESIMRHTFASMHVAAFSAPERASTMMGHESMRVFKKHYCNREVDLSEAEKFWNLTPANVNS